ARNRQQATGIEWTALDLVLQSKAVEELHRDKGAALLFADIVDGADVGMIERRRGARFAAEALEHLRIAGEIVGQELQRDKAAEAAVLGLVDQTHTASAQFVHEAVMRDHLVHPSCGSFDDRLSAVY